MSSADVSLSPRDELDLVYDEHMARSHDRATLKRVVADLSSTSLADIDVRAHIESRLRALEQRDRLWHLLAESSFERRVWHRIGQETRIRGER